MRSDTVVHESISAHLNLCATLRWSEVTSLILPYQDFLEKLKRVGLSVRQFVELIGMNPNSILNYMRAGELPTKLALISTLVVGISGIGGDYRRITSRVERVRKKPRGSTRSGIFGGGWQSNANA